MEIHIFLCTFLVLFTVTHLQVEVQGISLEQNGGYNIVVGISEDASPYTGIVTDWIPNVKEMISNFSEVLWEATNGTFHIKSAQIVVPESWGEELEANTSINATYHNADIQMSFANKIPRSENYYPCGKPGVRIQLPISFAHQRETSMEYGSQAKGLLNLWLRYRFGVWEEYGYPHNPITPLVYNTNDVIHTPWILTSCNNSKLEGDFEFESGSLNPGFCSRDGEKHMHKLCRFYPQSTHYNNSTTSVMNFLEIESITRLCDETNHDKLVPNRQNLHCNFRSIWEVIRSSPDFQLLNDTHQNESMSIHAEEIKMEKMMPRTEYNIVVQSPKPLLYILMDTEGLSDITEEDGLYHIWLDELTAFIDGLPSDVVTKLAAYPHRNSSTTYLVEKVGWTVLDDNVKSEIIELLNFAAEGNKSKEASNFRLPLAEAVSELKARHHPHGAIILALRTEAISWFNFYQLFWPGPYEEDFISTLKQYGITLCAIEIQVVKWIEPIATLEYLVSESNGLFGYIQDKEGSDSLSQITPVLEFIKDRLRQGIALAQEEYEIIYKEMFTKLFTNFYAKSVLIPKRDDFDFIHISVSIFGASLDFIRFQLPDLANPFNTRIAWMTNDSFIPEYVGFADYLTHSYTKSVKLSDMEDEEYNFWAWQLYLLLNTPWVDSVKGMIIVYGTRPKNQEPGTKHKQKPPRLLGNQLKAEIFTSANDNRIFGCLTREINEEPLAIYVKLRSIDEKPILIENPYNSAKERSNNEIRQSTLSAHLHGLKTGVAITAVLDDNGIGADLLAGDGIYSGYVYPPTEDGYRLYVMFNDSRSNISDDAAKQVNPIGILQTIRQTDLERPTNGITLNTPFSVVFDWPGILFVTEGCIDKAYISRVTDLRAEVADIEDKIVRVTFTVPFTIRSQVVTSTAFGEDLEINAYYMGMSHYSEDVEALTDDVYDGSPQVFLFKMTPAGRTESVLLNREKALAFNMELLDFRQPPTKSRDVSNIARVRGWRVDEPEPDPEDDEKPLGDNCALGCMLAIGFGCGFIIVVLTSISCMLWRKNKAQKAQLLIMSRDEIKEFLHGHQALKSGTKMSSQVGNEYLDCSERIQSLPYDSKYEIPNNKLHIDKTELLGSGTFGNVYKGYVVNLGGSSGKVLVVAVKTMKPNMDKSYFKALLDEVKLMTYIGGTHPNIVKLIGASTKNIRKCEVFMATEICENGNLSTYLLQLSQTNFTNLIDENGKLAPEDANNNEEGRDKILTTWSLIKWAREIANGMAFLGQKKIIHGDLAARNILLDSNLVAKISDFGLSKQLLQSQYGKYADNATEVDVESGGLLPWKWLAPEALTFSKFSVASDVWAYGVTMWEIFTLGQIPYPGIQWSPDFISKLEKTGLRLQKPDFATDTVYDMMLDCWKLEPRQRPGFSFLKTDFDQMMMTIAPGEYMDLQLTST